MVDESKHVPFVWRALFYTPKYRWILWTLVNIGVLLWTPVAVVGVVRGELPGLGGVVMLGSLLLIALPVVNIICATILADYPGAVSLFVWHTCSPNQRWFWTLVSVPFLAASLLCVIEPFFSGFWEFAIPGVTWVYLFACMRTLLACNKAPQA